MKTLAFLLVIGSALLLPGLARADVRTITDRHDTRGALDIQAVREGHNGNRVVHTVRTYAPFASSVLARGTAVGFAFDVDDDARTDNLALIFWSRGALHGVLADAKGKPLAALRVTRPDRRSVAVTIHEAQLGLPVRYRWLALTVFKGKPGCAKACTDVAPNRTLAVHQLAEPATLSVILNGSGRVSGGGQLRKIACPSTCRAVFRAGTEVSLTASPEQGWEFAGWGGACSGTAATCSVPLDESTSVTATFVPAAVLTVSTTGSGTVTVNPPGVGCSGPTCTFRYVTGTTVTISASAGPTTLFDGWGGACSGTTPVCVVTLNGATSVSANFVPRRSAILVSLDLRGGATGRVTSNPAGIDCPGDCNELFPEGYGVTLTQVAGPGSVFTGWNGSNVRDPSILLVIGLPFPGDRIVTATFERAP